MSFLPPFKNFGTDAIHAGQTPEKWTSRAVIPPISMSTTFKQDVPGETHVNINLNLFSSQAVLAPLPDNANENPV